MKQFNFNSKFEAYCCLFDISQKFDSGWDKVLLYSNSYKDVPDMLYEFYNIDYFTHAIKNSEIDLLQYLCTHNPSLVIQDTVDVTVDKLQIAICDKFIAPVRNDNPILALDATNLLENLENKPSHNSKSIENMKEWINKFHIVLYGYRYKTGNMKYNIVVEDKIEDQKYLEKKVKEFMEKNINEVVDESK